MCVAQPDSAPPANRYPVLIAVNGHGGSAWATLSPDDELRRARTAWTETPQRVLH